MVTQSSSEEFLESLPRLKRGFLLLRGLILPVQKNTDMILGRDRNECDIVLSDERVSKQHAAINRDKGRYIIRDLGSLNGIYVNEEQIKEPCWLVPGDQIQIQPFTMLFLGQEADASEPLDEDISDIPYNAQGDLSGQLSLIKVADLIQLLNSTGQSGVLTVTDVKAARAEVVFEQGEIVTAGFKDRLGEEAVFALLSVEEGKFTFTEGSQQPTADPIRRKTVSLLLEGCKAMDETEEREKTQPISVFDDDAPSS